MTAPRGFRIVLFGNPGAGKSALLGALWQVSLSQETVLGGKLNDLTGGLAELHQRLYTNQPRETLQEVSAYPITLQPTGAAKGAAVEATLIDCDGRIAQEFLARNQKLEGSHGALARAVVQADALILAIDPSLGGAQLEKEFQLFCDFVQTLEKYRSQRNEVAGLPVFIVLTKCDMLSKPTDQGSAWVQRIEEGKRKLDKRFHDFLGKIPHRDALPFGKVDVHLWATAVKRPQLADRPARPQEPYGVAELFRQCFQAAGAFHEQREQSQGRLHLAVLGFFSLIAVMAAAAALFFITRPGADLIALETRIKDNVAGQKATDRLKEPLEQRLKFLEEIQKDPAFSKLPPSTQEEVKQAGKEIEAYQRLNKRFVETVPDPKFAKDEDDLKKSAKALDQWTLSPDYKDYIDSWFDTKLIKKQQQYRKDIKQLEEVAKGEEKWFRDQIIEGKKLQKQGFLVQAGTVTDKEREAWFDQVKNFVDRSQRFKETERLPNSPITYGTVYRFRAVDRPRLEYLELKKELEVQRQKAAL